MTYRLTRNHRGTGEGASRDERARVWTTWQRRSSCICGPRASQPRPSGSTSPRCGTSRAGPPIGTLACRAGQRCNADHLRQWSAETIEGSSAGNASVHWRGLQQFLKWAEFEGEVDKNPMRGLAGPQVSAPIVPVIEIEQLQALLATVAGNTFVDRRDNAILRLLIDTGIRRGELVGLQLDDVNLFEREATVTGQGRRARVIRFGAKTAKAIDRYLRLRSRHPCAAPRALWLSPGPTARSPITGWR